MSRTIPIELAGVPEIEVDGELVARGFGLDVDEFRRLLDQGRITLLCERGTGDDAGLYRASFYHGTKRVRLVVDAAGALMPGSFSVEDMPVAGGRNTVLPPMG
ncbi:MAG TPA: DUF6522 family protein [Gammaproteobacteria bacterium]|nr:DUF6522 family protein [Luteimonas sp.]HRO27091.1 DUF6522 family protein [Luteimonas sp.]HRP35556.1 DUF6522 family protein [Gammaproteobacteria bacterium]HRP72047.1 DUF6522 family protein [Luteimonas sp.]